MTGHFIVTCQEEKTLFPLHTDEASHVTFFDQCEQIEVCLVFGKVSTGRTGVCIPYHFALCCKLTCTKFGFLSQLKSKVIQ